MKIKRIISSKIRYKLIAGFIFISLSVSVVSYISLQTIKDIKEGYKEISTKSAPLIKDLENMKFNCLRLISSASEFAYILAESKNISDDSPIEQEDELMQQSCIGCHSAFSKYESIIKESFPDANNHLDQIRSSGIMLREATHEFVEAKRAGIIGSEALEKKEEMEDAEMEFLMAVEFALEHTNKNLMNGETYLNNKISSSLQRILFLSGFTFLISVFIGILISHSISKPIIILTQLTNNFRKGNMDIEMNVKSFDEIGVLGKSFNEMAAKIKQLISQLEDEIEITKKAEEKLSKYTEELITVNTEKNKFFSIIAHDLKSPFNSIIGFSRILVELVKEEDHQGIEKYSNIILQSSLRAMDLLMNLMEWSLSQTGRMEFNPKYIEIDTLINKAVLLLTDSAEHKSITITNSLTPDVTVYADKNMISTVLRNLISNAIKFTHPGGEIFISTEEKLEGLIVSVSDNGVGIPKDRIDKLFRIDENQSTPGTQKEKGTGLGLILCKEFIENHGGNIWIESEEGKGSIFYFTIPYKKVYT